MSGRVSNKPAGQAYTLTIIERARRDTQRGAKMRRVAGSIRASYRIFAGTKSHGTLYLSIVRGVYSVQFVSLDILRYVDVDCCS